MLFHIYMIALNVANVDLLLTVTCIIVNCSGYSKQFADLLPNYYLYQKEQDIDLLSRNCYWSNDWAFLTSNSHKKEEKKWSNLIEVAENLSQSRLNLPHLSNVMVYGVISL